MGRPLAMHVRRTRIRFPLKMYESQRIVANITDKYLHINNKSVCEERAHSHPPPKARTRTRTRRTNTRTHRRRLISRTLATSDMNKTRHVCLPGRPNAARPEIRLYWVARQCHPEWAHYSLDRQLLLACNQLEPFLAAAAAADLDGSLSTRAMYGDKYQIFVPSCGDAPVRSPTHANTPQSLRARVDL